MEDLGFAIVLLLVALWIASWAILAAIVAGVRRVPTATGTLLGIALGPFGIMAVFALSREDDSLDARVPTPSKSHTADAAIDTSPPSRFSDVDPYA